jgi:GTP-binding protein Era
MCEIQDPSKTPASPALPALGENPEGYRSGFVAVIGLPNVGKSTLVNALVGREVLITSDKPQTTRHQIRCVSTTPARQILFVDTPGWLDQRRKIDTAMMREIRMGIDGVDLLVYLVDGIRPDLKRVTEIVSGVRKEGSKIPFLMLVSKIDKLGKAKVIPLLTKLHMEYAPDELIPVSGLTGDNLEELDKVLTGLLPEGPVLYPPETVVDRPETFLAAEFIREQIFRETRQEIPFATAVEIERYQEKDRTLDVGAVIYVDRKSQKGILLGKQGCMIREIKRRSIIRLKKYTKVKKVKLDLFVKVVEGWRDKAGTLKELGIGVEE